jgi:hypothetical protein
MQRTIILILSALFVILLVLAFNVRDLKDLGISKSISLLDLDPTEITKVVFTSEDTEYILEPYLTPLSEKPILLITEKELPKSNDTEESEAEPDLETTNKPTELTTDSSESPIEAETDQTTPVEDLTDELSEGEDTPSPSEETSDLSVTQYIGSKDSQNLLEALANLSVKRELIGTITDEKREAYGLKPALSHLEIHTESGTRVFDVGKSYGTEPRTRLRDTQTDRIYIVSMRAAGTETTYLNLFLRDKHRLKLDKCTMLSFEQVNRVDAFMNEKKLSFQKYAIRPSEEQYQSSSDDWRLADNPDEKHVMFTTWMMNLKRATVEGFETITNTSEEFINSKLKEMGLDTPLFRVELKSDDTVLERLSFGKQNGSYLVYSEMLQAIMRFPSETSTTETIYKNIPESFNE